MGGGSSLAILLNFEDGVAILHSLHRGGDADDQCRYDSKGGDEDEEHELNGVTPSFADYKELEEDSGEGPDGGGELDVESIFDIELAVEERLQRG